MADVRRFTRRIREKGLAVDINVAVAKGGSGERVRTSSNQRVVVDQRRPRTTPKEDT
jgi:hypothetical protein